MENTSAVWIGFAVPFPTFILVTSRTIPASTRSKDFDTRMQLTSKNKAIKKLQTELREEKQAELDRRREITKERRKAAEERRRLEEDKAKVSNSCISPNSHSPHTDGRTKGYTVETENW